MAMRPLPFVSLEMSRDEERVELMAIEPLSDSSDDAGGNGAALGRSSVDEFERVDVPSLSTGTWWGEGIRHAFARMNLCLCSIVACCGTTCAYCAQPRVLRDKYISFCRQNICEARDVRNAFNETPMIVKKVDDNHTHGESAACRSQATAQAIRIADTIGLQAYFYQRSRADELAHRLGSRSYYWAKDTSISPALMRPPSNAMHVIIDTDYYMDMPHFLAHQTRPTVLYTFVPQAAGSAEGEEHFFFRNDGSVYVMVAGGAAYGHQLWYYGTDNLNVTSTFCCCTTSLTSYLVDRKQISKHRQMILLTPQGRWGVLSAWLVAKLGAPTLERMDVVKNGYTRFDIMTPDGVRLRTTGRPETFACATIPATGDDNVAEMARINTLHLTLAQVKTTLNLADAEMAVLVAYHRERHGRPTFTMFPVREAVRTYQYYDEGFDDTAKPGHVAFMQPLVHGAFDPAQCYANDKRMIEKRVVQFKKMNGKLQMTAFLERVMNEFIDKLSVNAVQSLHPVDLEYIYEQQDRPTQRKIIDVAGNSLPEDAMLRVFMKRETYADVKDPRNISTVVGTSKLEYSSFMYTYACHLKRFKWYAFGRTPAKIAERMAEICVKSQTFTASDFHRWDGHVSGILRELERRIMLRLFHADYHVELIRILRDQYNLTGKSRFGIKYTSGTSRASGSSETSDFNTTENAATAYFGYRMTKRGGAFLTPDEAWDALGIYGGDDGGSGDMDPAAYQKAASAVGQVLEIATLARGSPKVEFLSRWYGPDVWNGDSNSCCDLPRQLAKLHVTVVLPPGITPMMKLHQKLLGYRCSDAHTPVLREILTVFREHGGFDQRHMAEDLARKVRSYYADLSPDDQYHNVDADWMRDRFADEMPSFDYDLFLKWISKANGDSLLSMPLCADIKPAKSDDPVVVDGDLIGKLKSKPPKPKPLHGRSVDELDCADGAKRATVPMSHKSKRVAAHKAAPGAKARSKNVRAAKAAKRS